MTTGYTALLAEHGKELNLLTSEQVPGMSCSSGWVGAGRSFRIMENYKMYFVPVS